MYDFYLRYNPIIVFVLRPTLRLVNAHKYPRIGGLCAAIASALAHYGIILPFAWVEGGIVATAQGIPLFVHVAFGITILSNLIIGFDRYYRRAYAH